jgi:hypothetical protein
MSEELERISAEVAMVMTCGERAGRRRRQGGVVEREAVEEREEKDGGERESEAIL